MKGNGKTIMFIVFILVVLGGGYYLYKKYAGNLLVSSSNSITSTLPGLLNLQGGVLPSQSSPTMNLILLSPPGQAGAGSFTNSQVGGLITA